MAFSRWPVPAAVLSPGESPLVTAVLNASLAPHGCPGAGGRLRASGGPTFGPTCQLHSMSTLVATLAHELALLGSNIKLFQGRGIDGNQRDRQLNLVGHSAGGPGHLADALRVPDSPRHCSHLVVGAAGTRGLGPRAQSPQQVQGHSRSLQNPPGWLQPPLLVGVSHTGGLRNDTAEGPWGLATGKLRDTTPEWWPEAARSLGLEMTHGSPSAAHSSGRVWAGVWAAP